MTELNAPLIAHLESGGTVVTGTRRQARLLLRLQEAAQRRAGRRVWPSADVLPLESWLERSWHACAGGGSVRLLGVAQAQWLWRREVEQSGEATLVDARALGAAARASWVELVRRGGTCTELAPLPLTRDQQCFLGWARGVEARLVELDWLDPACLPAWLGAHADALPERQPLLFAGVEPTPALRGLARALAAAGRTVDWAAAGRPAAPLVAAAAEHPQAELEALLGWVAARLRRDPGALLGVLVPDLAGRRGGLQREFAAALQPELELPGALERDRRFDLAGGPPLAACAVVADALGCLDTAAPAVEWTLLSRLLRSPHVGAAEEQEARLRLDVAWRQQGLFRLGAADWARRARGAGAPVFAEALEASAALAAAARRRPAGQWADLFGRLLRAWRWPGPRPLASDEFQAAERFREALAGLAGIESVAPPLDADAARSELAQGAAQPFQPERGDAPVLVYDAHEAPGLELDGLWVSGLTAARFPPPATPDPFLPLPLQRRLGVPGATAEACRDEAAAVLAAWRASAAEVIVSWPCRLDDADTEPSPLLPAGMMPYTAPETAVATGRAASMLAWPAIERLDDDRGPPLGPDGARGGARILDLQAKCPFRAFAELRLAARPLAEPQPGIDPRVRGNALHAALERAWRELGGSDALQALDAGARTALVARCVAVALDRHLPAHCGPRQRRLEADWQQAAIEALFEQELRRAPFSVAVIEGRLEGVLGGLPLDLRVDRVDRLPAGDLIVDYKTGRTSIGHWRGARPEAPQLPLYAVMSPAPVAAVAFAAASPGQARFGAVGEAAAALPGLTPAERFRLTEDGRRGFSWSEVQAHWAAWLARLAERFRAGEAAVDPKQPQTCRLCHLATLCRVQPAQTADTAGPAEDDDDDA